MSDSRYRIEDVLDKMFQNLGASSMTICLNPADGGFACFVKFPDKRSWLSRLFSPTHVVESWGESPAEAVRSMHIHLYGIPYHA